MKGKLALLNLGLVVLIGFVGWKIYANARAAEERMARMFGVRPKQEQVVIPAVPGQVNPVTAMGYRDVADKMLFSPDRNPTVVVEVVEPKPMPPLPAAQGIVNLGGGPVALMAEKAGDSFKFVSPGQMVGEFRLVALSMDAVTLEWNGERIRKKLIELKNAQPAPAAASAERPASAAPPAVTVKQEEKGPGIDLGAGAKACQPGDTTPPGTVRDGYRKLFTPTPFGGSCRWEPVQ